MENNKRPVTQVIIDREEHQRLHEFATTLETIAKKLKEEGTFHFTEGNHTTPITPSDNLKVEYSYEIKGDKHSFEIEFDWYTGQKEQATFKIE
ncbi:amphi-Trp domain-containing protein [Vagococcus lutrae]|uniref:amphi-Trp domain-containing protein n=1 Tax=Vagococcus lutrae TaxID=81947 RepID=UPI00200E95E8|nr:amphi-Trp domain-containing protein [Vagococcus lutrae]UQF71061.1 amphi-Trp domain-containing protein [Vagococcus lutrae]